LFALDRGERDALSEVVHSTSIHTTNLNESTREFKMNEISFLPGRKSSRILSRNGYRYTLNKKTDFGFWSKFWSLFKILDSVQNFGVCSKFWILFKILDFVQNFGFW